MATAAVQPVSAVCAGRCLRSRCCAPPLREQRRRTAGARRCHRAPSWPPPDRSPLLRHQESPPAGKSMLGPDELRDRTTDLVACRQHQKEACDVGTDLGHVDDPDGTNSPGIGSSSISSLGSAATVPAPRSASSPRKARNRSAPRTRPAAARVPSTSPSCGDRDDHRRTDAIPGRSGEKLAHRERVRRRHSGHGRQKTERRLGGRHQGQIRFRPGRQPTRHPRAAHAAAQASAVRS
ncbi:hypothetical protein UA75_28190 [Actinoalloteichus sp. GBA129-24]|nr:hypothetical protein UA75_28190 [Actinoalloteichus sp. GBA129-24]